MSMPSHHHQQHQHEQGEPLLKLRLRMRLLLLILLFPCCCVRIRCWTILPINRLYHHHHHHHPHHHRHKSPLFQPKPPLLLGKLQLQLHQSKSQQQQQQAQTTAAVTETEPEPSNDDDEYDESLEQEQEQDFEKLSPGLSTDFYVVKQYPTDSFSIFNLTSLLNVTLDRLSLTSTNVTVPIALMLVDPVTYPSLSRARKACRKRSILVAHISNDDDDDDDDNNNNSSNGSSSSSCSTRKRTVGLVGDRVVPGDILQLQLRFGSGYFPYTSTRSHSNVNSKKKRQLSSLSFDLPVMYEDDHFAIVHKPAGILVYKSSSPSSQKSSNSDTNNNNNNNNNSSMTVHAALVHVLTPPSRGTRGVLNRPRAVHRLDKATSGCLVVAKTKPAMVNLCRQFHERLIRKTYLAVVNGRVPVIDDSTAAGTSTATTTSVVNQMLSWEQARDEYGVVTEERDDEHHGSSSDWYLIDTPLQDDTATNTTSWKRAVTLWRPLRYSASRFANDETLTLVELKPKTGRFHQLRRHMAWFCHRPIVGDANYDGGGGGGGGENKNATKLRGRGLFLCATRITLEHPYYSKHNNNPQLNLLLDRHSRRHDEDEKNNADDARGGAWVSLCRDNNSTKDDDDDDKVMVTAQVPIPAKFMSLLQHEQERFVKFQ